MKSEDIALKPRKHSIWGYILGILLIFPTAGLFLVNPGAGLCFLLATLLVFPPTANQLLDKVNLAPEKRKSVRVVGALLAFLVAGILMPNSKLPESPNSSSNAPKNRKEVVESHFSVFDGSHSGFVDAIKSKMNDPDSFEHVSTNVWDMKKTIRAKMTYRGKNAFGGVITNRAWADIDPETGALLKWGMD
ncbi:hypothetical protein ACO2Q8_07970 [Larkinella sp. VNQ87]|uniref:hypothetical protein n=1 Tax=Larkinella sp. VNQ87 TaxID=3400921 RepID=UPI003BFB3A8F